LIISFNKRVIPDVSSIASKYSGKTICVAVDTSKTNTAICVMSRTYKVLDLIEMNGSQDKDVLELIKVQRRALNTIFNGAEILDAGIEDIITKKEEEAGGKFSEGLKHHHSRYVITAVFISFITFFQDNFDYTLDLIPNQAWKSVILPKDLNKRTVYKGSVEYIRDQYPQYITGDKDDDGADAICIGEYMKVRKGFSKESSAEDIPDEGEFVINPCKYRLYPRDTPIKVGIGVQFEYNNTLNLDMNARAIANRIKKGQLGWALLTIDQVEISEIYALCATNKFEEKTTHFMVIVKRTE
jgi:hypothetical protein